jgi:hypothetical protein
LRTKVTETSYSDQLHECLLLPFSEARGKNVSVRCVPFSAPCTAHFSVSLEKTDAQFFTMLNFSKGFNTN